MPERVKNRRRVIAFVIGLIVLALALAVLWGYRPGERVYNLTPVILKNRAPVSAAPLHIVQPSPRVFTLSNGLRVFILEDHRLPYVRLTLTLPAGSLVEAKPALADMTASMLLEGAGARSEAQVAEFKDRYALTLTAWATPATTQLYGGALSEHADRLLALLSDVALRPAFASDRLARLQYRKCTELDSERSGSDFVNLRIGDRLFYGGTPLGRNAWTPAEINALTPLDLAAFHRRWYRPNGAVLGVVGDVQTAAFLRRVGAAFAGWAPQPGPSDLPPCPLAAPPPAGAHLVDWPNGTDAILSFQVRTVARTSPDYLPLLVANRVLGGVSSARLSDTLRERQGLTYGASSTLADERWPNVWRADVIVAVPQAGAAVATVRRELARLQDEPVPADELERAKRGLIGSFAVATDGPGTVAAREVSLLRDGLAPDYWAAYPRNVAAVTSDDVRRVARKYLAGRVQVIAIGPKAKLAPVLSGDGPIELLDETGSP